MSPTATIVNLQRAALAAQQAYGLDHPITAHIRAEIARHKAARESSHRPGFNLNQTAKK